MKPLKDFNEFLTDMIVRRRRPDTARARSLVEEAENRIRFMSDMQASLGLSDSNANYYIENAYDALISLVRARLLVDGYYASGEGAHEAEVSYLRVLGFMEKDVRFMNDLRFYRNGILYYGRKYDAEYARKVVSFLSRM